MGPIMKCGCAANSQHSNPHGKFNGPHPSCVVHFGLESGCCEPLEIQPDFVGRRARCAWFGKSTRRNECGKCQNICQDERDSDPTQLAFFVSQPNEPFDQFYCGCHSWD